MNAAAKTVLLGTVAGSLVGCAHTRPALVAAHEPAPVVTHKPPPVRPAVSPSPLRRASRSRPVTGLPTVLLRIRSCESGPDGYATHGWAMDYDYTLTNPVSSASGAYQFLDSTWHYVTGLPGRAKDYSRAVQDRAALKLLAAEGTTPWAASRRCWS